MINNTNNNVKKLLVLGGTGFIGRHLVEKISKTHMNFEITVVSLHEDRSIINSKKVKFISLDINKYDEVELFLKNNSFEYIVNLAGYINHSDFWNEGYEVINNHLIAQLKLIKCLSYNKIKRFVQIGSSAEYGNSNCGQLESDISFPTSPYAYAKLSTTNLIKMLHQSQGFPGVVVRFFLVYGPYQKQDRLVPYVINACLKNQSFKTTDGKQKRDFCYIDDAIEGIIATLFKDEAVGEIFNIASGVPIQIQEMVDNILNEIGSGIQHSGFVEKDNENEILYANIEKAKNLLDWEPKTSLREGLKKTILAYKKAINDEK